MAVEVWAHRGNSCQFPENTLEAFESALALGSDGLELDVHMTCDQQIVVTHDESIERVSNGRGRVADQTLAQLRSYNFHKTKPHSVAMARIPLLAEVLELVKPSQAMVNIEIKSGIVLYKGIEKAVWQLVRDFGMEDRILYSSFNHFSLTTLKQIDPHTRIGLLYSEAMVDPALYAKHVQADAIHPFFPNCFAPGVMEGCRAEEIMVNPWTVDDPEMMRSLKEVGVHAVITNDPGMAISVLR